MARRILDMQTQEKIRLLTSGVALRLGISVEMFMNALVAEAEEITRTEALDDWFIEQNHEDEQADQRYEEQREYAELIEDRIEECSACNNPWTHCECEYITPF